MRVQLPALRLQQSAHVANIPSVSERRPIRSCRQRIQHFRVDIDHDALHLRQHKQEPQGKLDASDVVPWILPQGVQRASQLRQLQQQNLYWRRLCMGPSQQRLPSAMRFVHELVILPEPDHVRVVHQRDWNAVLDEVRPTWLWHNSCLQCRPAVLLLDQHAQVSRKLLAVQRQLDLLQPGRMQLLQRQQVQAEVQCSGNDPNAV